MIMMIIIMDLITKDTLEAVCCKKQKKSSWPVTGFLNRGPLKILNVIKLILDDQGNHLDSFTTSLESFKSFRGPLFRKPVSGQGLFLLAQLCKYTNYKQNKILNMHIKIHYSVND